MVFDPKMHFIQIPQKKKNPKTGAWEQTWIDYLPVSARVAWFRESYPHGTIEAEIISLDWEHGVAVFRATVSDGQGGSAVAYAHEARSAFLDFMEKANTRSVGRALAFLGMGTLEAAEDLSEGTHVADGPVKVSHPADPQPVPAGSPDDPYLTRLEEQKEMQAAKVTDGPFVGSAPQGPASTAVQDSAGLGAFGMPSQKTTPITSKKPAALKRPELLIAIKMQFTRLAGTDQQLAQDFCRDIWGKGVSSWKMVESLTDASLRTGLSKLEKKSPEQPLAVPLPAGEGATSSPAASSSASAEEDVPTFPPPGGNPQEGPQLPPGSTQGVGGGFTPAEGEGLDGSPKRCLIVQEGTGISCAREVREDGTHEGNHYFDPGRPEARAVKLPAREQVIVVPDPDTGVRYVSTSDGMLLRQFCQQHDLMEFFSAAVAKSPRNLHGNIMIAERQYWQMRAFVEAQVSMGSPEVSA